MGNMLMANLNTTKHLRKNDLSSKFIEEVEFLPGKWNNPRVIDKKIMNLLVSNTIKDRKRKQKKKSFTQAS